MASSSSNPDLSKDLSSLSLSGPIDPWSRPIDDNDPEDPPATANPPAISSDTDTAPPGPDGPLPLPTENPPFAPSVPEVHVDQAVLDDFDPVGNKAEQEARSAWEQSEPHPPPPVVSPKSSLIQSDPVAQDNTTPLPTNAQSLPPPAPIPIPDPVPAPPITDKPLPDTNATISTTQDLAQSISRSTTPSLSGLAAIARTFIPKSPARKSRPLSIDQAAVISSPTAAAFGVSAQEHGSGHHGPALSPLNPEAQSERNDNQPQTPGSAPRTSKNAAGDVNKDQPPPFDFQFFLEQMKSKPAEPVARYLRSYVTVLPHLVLSSDNCSQVPNQLCKTYIYRERSGKVDSRLSQRKITSPSSKLPSKANVFQFIAEKMQECDVWKNVTEVELDNALEGMEKLVMNRLYD